MVAQEGMNEDKWQRTHAYIAEVHGSQSAFMASITSRALAAGLPDIAVSAEVGHLLALLTSLTNSGRGAERVLEIGTLAGYSALWLLQGVSPTGTVTTCDPNHVHADFAESIFEEAGESDRIDVRRQPGLEVFAALEQELGPESLDVVFLDAIKHEYPQYFVHARRLLKPGGILLGDNALGARSYWITDDAGTSADRDGLDRFNRDVAEAPEFESSLVPLRQGILIARKQTR